MKHIYLFIQTFVFVIISTTLFSQAPVITEQPLSGEKCAGNLVSFHVTATGAPTLHYQWFMGSNPVGTDSDTYTIASVNATHEGTYYCVVTNLSGTATSNNAILLVAGGIPVINSYSDDSELCEGEDLSLSVNVSANHENYSWYMQDFGLVHIGALYNMENLTAGDSGDYYCEVTNVCGMVATGYIEVIVNQMPVFVTIPQSVETCEGNDVGFTVEATGTDIQYKWLADGVEMFGETENTLAIENVVYPNYILYQPVVYNNCDTIYGPEISITVLANPQITGNPLSQGECDGEDIHLIATAFGNTSFTYQWYFNEEILDGEINNFLDVVTEEGVIDSYYCIVSNNCISVSTDTAYITGYEAAIITQQPVDSVVCSGNDASFACKANGEEPLYYQWLFNGANVPWTNVTGANTSTLQFTDVFTGQQGTYTCFVYNDCGSVTTEPAELTVNTAPEIIIQPEDITVCAGEDVVTEILVEGTLPINYNWINTVTSESAGIAEQLSFENIVPGDAGNFRCDISNECGDVSTNEFAIIVNTAPVVVSEPNDLMACEGDSVGFIVEATGTEPIDYLWYRNSSAESWATDDTIVFNPAAFGHTGIYFCRLHNLCGEIDSNPFDFVVGTPPDIEWNSGDQYLCEWDTLNLTVDPAGENLMYEWYFNDNLIGGANDSVLVINLINETNAGIYYCRVFNACDEVFTDDMQVNINPAPALDLGDDIETCQGNPVILNPEGEYQSYNWNNGLSSNPQLEVMMSGTFFLEVVGTNTCSNYDTINVVIHPVVVVDFGDDIYSCSDVVLSAPEGAYSYEWNNSPVTTNQIIVTETGTYSVTTTGDAYGCESTDNVYVVILESPDINLGIDHVIAIDSTISIGVDAIYDDYIWFNGFNGPLLTVSGQSLGVGTHDVWLRVVAENGCTDTDSVIVTVFDNSGFGNIAANNLCSIYPNPAKDRLNIVAEFDYSGIVNISLVDLRSVIIFNDNVYVNGKLNYSVGVEHIAKGIYMINIVLENGSRMTKKLIIQ